MMCSVLVLESKVLNWMLMGYAAVEELVLMDVPLCLVLGVLVYGLWCPVVVVG